MKLVTNCSGPWSRLIVCPRVTWQQCVLHYLPTQASLVECFRWIKSELSLTFKQAVGGAMVLIINITEVRRALLVGVSPPWSRRRRTENITPELRTPGLVAAKAWNKEIKQNVVKDTSSNIKNWTIVSYLLYFLVEITFYYSYLCACAILQISRSNSFEPGDLEP